MESSMKMESIGSVLYLGYNVLNENASEMDLQF